jgi:hypothetical protein
MWLQVSTTNFITKTMMCQVGLLLSKCSYRLSKRAFCLQLQDINSHSCTNIKKFLRIIWNLAGIRGRAVYGVGLRPLAYWDCWFESSRGHGCLSLVGVVCCQQSSLRRADQLSRGVLPSVVCLSVVVNPR